MNITERAKHIVDLQDSLKRLTDMIDAIKKIHMCVTVTGSNVNATRKICAEDGHSYPCLTAMIFEPYDA